MNNLAVSGFEAHSSWSLPLEYLRLQGWGTGTGICLCFVSQRLSSDSIIFCCPGILTHGFMLAKQALYRLSHIVRWSSLFIQATLYFNIPASAYKCLISGGPHHTCLNIRVSDQQNIFWVKLRGRWNIGETCMHCPKLMWQYCLQTKTSYIYNRHLSAKTNIYMIEQIT
jgi:hypothetical protein